MGPMKMDIQGEAALMRVLRSIEGKHQRVLVRPALGAGSSPIAKEMKRRAPVDTGVLAKSVAVKRAKAFRGDPQALYAAAGPRRRVKVPVKRGNRTITAIPTKYAHLADKHRPFMEAAVQAAGPMAREKMIAVLRRNIGRAFDKGKI